MSDVRIVPLDEFIGTEEPSAEPLIGERHDTLLPAGGRLLMYGDGGAGKTTFTVDAIAHLAAGMPWLGLAVVRPLRFLIIENEGPRGMFREKLGLKVLDWTGPPFRHNVDVLEEPWAQFQFDDLTVTDPVVTHIEQREIDVLVAGPLASLGTIGGGTPAEVQAFVRLLDAMKAAISRPYAEWLVHHENKSGAVSGAWDRVPDTLVHVQGQGNGRTRITWEKARHSSALHATSTNLIWTDGKSFAIEDTKGRDLHAELVAAFTADNKWRTAKEAASLIGANVDNVRDALESLVPAVMQFEQGPAGRAANAKCWRLRTDSDMPSQSESPTLLDGGVDGTDSLTSPSKEVSGVSQCSSPVETDSGPASQNSEVPA